MVHSETGRANASNMFPELLKKQTSCYRWNLPFPANTQKLAGFRKSITTISRGGAENCIGIPPRFRESSFQEMFYGMGISGTFVVSAVSSKATINLDAFALRRRATCNMALLYFLPILRPLAWIDSYIPF